MTFSDKDEILIKSLHLSKGYNASRLLAKFPDKGWTKRIINRLFQKFRSSEKLVLLTDVSAVAGHAVLERKKTSILLMI